MIGGKYPKKAGIKIAYDNTLAHKIEAGCDMFLMPSRYEPCGLSQMIAMRYGCITIARATGGLSDTIQDSSNNAQGTGFLFKSPKSEALTEAIQRALYIFRHNPQEWRAMQIRGMKQDFSWDRSAVEYVKQYKLLLDKRTNRMMSIENMYNGYEAKRRHL